MSALSSGFARLTRVLLIASAIGLSACASTTTDATGDYPDVNDPLESVNRKVDSFNTLLDDNILAPTARAYKSYVPYVFRYSFSSFFSNLGDVWIGANNLMQGKPREAISDWTRVLLNTTFGFFGFSDPASEMGWEKHHEDFGQTLAVWGVPTGPYIVLPLLGPSSVRGTAGVVADFFADPTETVIDDRATRQSLAVVNVVDVRAKLLGAGALIDGIAFDKYTFLRDAYRQRRRSQVYDGEPPEDLE